MLVYAAMLARVAEQADRFDLMHVHLDWIHIPLMRCLSVPFVTILHGRLDHPALATLSRGCFADAHFVSISNAQRIPLPHACWAGTVYHGMPEDLLTPNYEPKGYLAFLGHGLNAINRAVSLDRRLVCQRFEARFTARRMAEDYVCIYESVITAARDFSDGESTELRMRAG